MTVRFFRLSLPSGFRWDVRGAVVSLAPLLATCAPTGFQDPALVQSGVRILASNATLPFAHPGDSTDISVLAFDGRTVAQRAANPEPMHLYWLEKVGDDGTLAPFLCENPTDDAYYACFSKLAGAVPVLVSGGGAGNIGGLDAGASDAAMSDAAASEAGLSDAGDNGAPGALDATGGEPDAAISADASATSDGGASPLPYVATVHVTIPTETSADANAAADAGAGVEDIIRPRLGGPDYGLLIGFNVLCAGHLQVVPIDPANINPQALPIGCFDSAGHALGPENYVIGFTRVYVYRPNDPAGSATVNTNPIITAIDTPHGDPEGGAGTSPQTLSVDGGASAPNLTVNQPFVAPLCTPAGGDCPHPKIGPVVPESSWEPATNGKHEEIWADYYSTFGSFKSSTRLLYDPSIGSLGPPGTTDTEFQPPLADSTTPRDGFIWIVVHDSRGGSAWVTIPVVLGAP